MKTLLLSLMLMLCAVALAGAASLDRKYQVTPEELAKQVQAGNAPLILNVGPKALYDQAHIRGSEYVGAGSSADGIAKLRERVKALPKKTAIVLYCGCCPWDHCPNVDPALAELQKLGFTHVKVMYVAHNIGTDWVDKGYPVDKGN